MTEHPVFIQQAMTMQGEAAVQIHELIISALYRSRYSSSSYRKCPWSRPWSLWKWITILQHLCTRKVAT